DFLELIPDNLRHAYEQHRTAKQDGDIDLSRTDFEKYRNILTLTRRLFMQSSIVLVKRVFVSAKRFQTEEYFS
ncbi:MAG: hypothetical protein SOW29_02905, partial [Candidatus Faecousia sp.]|nr:hypothetical protein [Candidatus Faecousia sp.]